MEYSRRHVSRLIAINRNRILNQLNNVAEQLDIDDDVQLDSDDDADIIEIGAVVDEGVFFDDVVDDADVSVVDDGDLVGDNLLADVDMNDGDNTEDDSYESDDSSIDDIDELDRENEVDDIVEAADGEINEQSVQSVFRNRLAAFVRKSNLSCENTTILLKLLREDGRPELPESRQSLLHTPRTPIVIRQCPPGEYYHFGLKKCLKRCNFSFLQETELVEIDINIDGVSLAKSSKLKLWPILGAFPGHLNTSPFLIGCYVGRKDPANIEIYLQEFVDELIDVTNNGCLVTPQSIRKPFKVRLFTCDMPGRSFVKGVLGHTSLFGCDRCHQKCYHIRRTMIYQTTIGPERTDLSFRNREHIEHHQVEFQNRPMLLEHPDLQLDMVSQFVLDDMHLVHLGVTKHILLNVFILAHKCNSVYLQTDAKRVLDTLYISYAPYIPSEFTRKTRTILEEVRKWKATEFRLFLLYTGIVLFRDKVGSQLYKHFLLLSLSMRYLSANATYEENAMECERMLQKFVEDYGTIYNADDVVYRIHALLHVLDDVRKYGPIGSYSAYRFENHQREIKKHVKKFTKILPQIYNRLEEIETVNEININTGFIGQPRPRQIDQDIFPGCNSSYRGFKYNAFILQANLRDGCCLVTSSDIPIEIHGFIDYEGEHYMIGKKFVNPRNFFTDPHESIDYALIYLVDAPMSEEVIFFKADEVRCKMMRLPYGGSFVLLPILHHLD